MKQFFILVAAMLCCGMPLRAGDIHVSASSGDDKAAGTAAAPLRTVGQALKQAREWRRLNLPQAEGGINIILGDEVIPWP